MVRDRLSLAGELSCGQGYSSPGDSMGTSCSLGVNTFLSLMVGGLEKWNLSCPTQAQIPAALSTTCLHEQQRRVMLVSLNLDSMNSWRHVHKCHVARHDRQHRARLPVWLCRQGRTWDRTSLPCGCEGSLPWERQVSHGPEQPPWLPSGPPHS